MDRQERHFPSFSLTEREMEVLRQLAEGLSNREIADRLVTTTGTVKWYNRQIYNKMGVSTRVEAVRRALELQLLDQDRMLSASDMHAASPFKHNLPAEATHFIGRKRELAAVRRLLQMSRLVTLTGSPGTGKTRLALRLGHELVDWLPDSAYVVFLAPITDPAVVEKTIAEVLGVAFQQEQPLIETLKQALRTRQILLILDNFEHLLPTASLVSELLTAAPGLKVLVTSREALHLYGEQEYTVPPLELPDADHFDLETLTHCESVALFVQRAQAAQSDFTLTMENAQQIAQICQRVEGLPLAIELSAARVKLFTPSALLMRLSKPLDALTGGARDLPLRQRTLRQTIDWSYELLDDNEKRLFRRLAVFVGGWTLEAVEAVGGADLDIPPVDVLSSLVDKSLVYRDIGTDGEPRFHVLEMIREYAAEQLRASGEIDKVRMSHTEYFAAFTRKGSSGLIGPEQTQWRLRLDAELGNCRGAMSWCLASRNSALGLEIADALVFFWYLADHVTEACQWFDQLLKDREAIPVDLRAKALTSAAVATFYRGDHERSIVFCHAGLDLARQTGKRQTAAWGLIFLGANQMRPVMPLENFKSVLALFAEAMDLFRQVDNRWGMARCLTVTGETHRLQGDYVKAGALYQESLVIFRELDNLWGITMSLFNLGYVALFLGDAAQAVAQFREGLALSQTASEKQRIASALAGLAGVVGMMHHPQAAAHLFGAAEALFESIGVKIAPGDRADYERNVAATRVQLDAETFAHLWQQGREMPLEQVITYALELDLR